jgi:hypothetical protein
MTSAVICGSIWITETSGAPGPNPPAAPAADPTFTTGSAAARATTPPRPTDATPTETAETAETATADPVADPEAVALTTLRSLRAADRAHTRLDGHFVAQLASKYPGITDVQEVSADGDHAFSAAEILQQHEELRNTLGSSVILLLSTDYGKRQKVDGHALWVTFADPGLTSQAAVAAWCRKHFPGMTATERSNSCTPRRLTSG